jgi:hypothetical protein
VKREQLQQLDDMVAWYEVVDTKKTISIGRSGHGTTHYRHVRDPFAQVIPSIRIRVKIDSAG